MKLIQLATATAAVALLGGAAYAQDPATKDTTPPAETAAPPADTAAPPADTSASATTSAATSTTTTSTDVTAPAATTAGANVSFTSMTVTNGPVPDTKENRAKYGAPLSRAGKMTAARGN